MIQVLEKFQGKQREVCWKTVKVFEGTTTVETLLSPEWIFHCSIDWCLCIESSGWRLQQAQRWWSCKKFVHPGPQREYLWECESDFYRFSRNSWLKGYTHPCKIRDLNRPGHQHPAEPLANLFVQEKDLNGLFTTFRFFICSHKTLRAWNKKPMKLCFMIQRLSEFCRSERHSSPMNLNFRKLREHYHWHATHTRHTKFMKTERHPWQTLTQALTMPTHNHNDYNTALLTEAKKQGLCRSHHALCFQSLTSDLFSWLFSAFSFCSSNLSFCLFSSSECCRLRWSSPLLFQQCCSPCGQDVRFNFTSAVLFSSSTERTFSTCGSCYTDSTNDFPFAVLRLKRRQHHLTVKSLSNSETLWGKIAILIQLNFGAVKMSDHQDLYLPCDPCVLFCTLCFHSAKSVVQITILSRWKIPQILVCRVYLASPFVPAPEVTRDFVQSKFPCCCNDWWQRSVSLIRTYYAQLCSSWIPCTGTTGSKLSHCQEEWWLRYVGTGGTWGHPLCFSNAAQVTGRLNSTPCQDDWSQHLLCLSLFRVLWWVSWKESFYPEAQMKFQHDGHTTLRVSFFWAKIEDPTLASQRQSCALQRLKWVHLIFCVLILNVICPLCSTIASQWSLSAVPMLLALSRIAECAGDKTQDQFLWSKKFEEEVCDMQWPNVFG